MESQKMKARWMKIHLAIDLRTGKPMIAEATDDTMYLEKALKETNRRKGKVVIDGAAESVTSLLISIIKSW
jgi:hypothetical protein